MYILFIFSITKKQVFQNNNSVRFKVTSHILSVGGPWFCVSTRLFNDKTRKISFSNKVVSTAYFLASSKYIKDKDRKVDIHNSSEPNKTQQISNKLLYENFGSSEIVQKKLKLVRRNVIYRNNFLNKSVKNKLYKISSLNMMIIQDKKEREDILINKIQYQWNKKKKKFVNLHKVMFDPQILIFAYIAIINSKGKNVINLNEINFEKIVELSDSLLNKIWIKNFIKKIRISKFNISQSQMLIVSSLYHKITVTSIYMVLNIVFERYKKVNYLSENSYLTNFNHSFRANKGCHTVLNTVTTWRAVKWFFYGYVEKCFESIHKKKLVSVITKSIEDLFLLNILNKFFSIFIRHKIKTKSQKSLNGKIQYEDSLFLLLVNIYLNEFDQFMIILRKEINESPFFLQNQIQSKTSMILPNHIYYVRHFDHFLIGIRSSNKIVQIIKKKSFDFLKLDLHLKVQKEELVCGKNNKINFLGFDIKFFCKKNHLNVDAKKKLSFKKLTNKICLKKKSFEARFEKAIMKTYEAKKLKTLKVLLKKKDNLYVRNDIISSLAILDAKKIMKIVKLKGIQWIHNQEPFETWVSREYNHLQESWIKETELIELGYRKVVKAYYNFVKVLEESLHSKNTFKTKQKTVTSDKVKSQFSLQKAVNLSPIQFYIFLPKLYAPIYQLKNKLKTWHIISKWGKPKACIFVLNHENIFIIEFFKQKAVSLLNYYKPACNFYEVKKLVNYHLRWSLIYTLATKYSTKIYKIISKYGKTPRVKLINDKKEKLLAEFLTPNDINNKSQGFFVSKNSCYPKY